MQARIERATDGAMATLILDLTPRELVALRQGSEATEAALRRAIREAEAREAQD